ncbi:hypothetical protein [Carboxydocella sp. JDF658]|uniref:hypothetical protein n=1 Tax=Carboxydocella sp. JDF658 TaxID=1926600 RepID=UPI0009AEC38C|nr:hypothetical protein [Carboxydocella sp. JDF658]GAW30736.1 hypothetical protein JDF658_05010 [Carboxydocella sp. JDF658]
MGVTPEMIREFEAIIRQIKDVVSAKIVSNEYGEVQEVHVLAKQNRSPKQLVRDIESAVMAQFGVALDHKKISVAQMANEEEIPVTEVRPKLIRAELFTEGVQARAEVELQLGDDTMFGRAQGPGAYNNKLRLVAQATLDALERYLRGNCTFAVDDVAIIHLGRKQAAVVAVTLVTPEEEEALIGSAYVRVDEWETVVKATLNAVNRRLSLLVKP